MEQEDQPRHAMSTPQSHMEQEDQPRHATSEPALHSVQKFRARQRSFSLSQAVSSRPQALRLRGNTAVGMNHSEEAAGDPEETTSSGYRKGHYAWLVLGAAGVVFGDIGTSVLYTFSGIFVEVLGDTHPIAEDTVGAFSMIFWMLTLVVGVKYVMLVMRVSHHGEGGTFAMLQTILESESNGGALHTSTKAAVSFLAMLGVSLVVGDGCITPAVSVMSAIEGIPVDVGESVKLALGVVILVSIFVLQCKGSAFIGMLAGPVTVVWFATLAALGVYNLTQHPTATWQVASGLSPYSCIWFWAEGNFRGYDAWRTLAGVVLCVTGAEALYADMGHFGAGPISTAWWLLVYPSLVLQYMGQAAVMIDEPSSVSKPFFSAVPDELRWPVVILATLATIVASQAMITGLFSIMSQATAMKYMPRIKVLHTNADEQGQVYIPEVNWSLCAACIAITIAFKTSDRLTGAYGIAVTSTFLLTTILLFIVMRQVWRWPLLPAVLVVSPFFLLDVALWSSNILKIVGSGWVPVVISVAMCLLMHTHFWGRAREEAVMAQECQGEAEELGRTGRAPSCFTVPGLLAEMSASDVVRGQKAVVFMTPHPERVPRTVSALASLLGYLPKVIVLLSVNFESVPFVSEGHRSTFKALGGGIFSIILHFGYAEPLTFEQFSIRRTLARVLKNESARHSSLRMLALQVIPGPDGVDVEEAHDSEINEKCATTFVLHKLHYAVRSGDKHGFWDRIRISLYSFLVLNARRPISFFGLEGLETMEISVVRFL
eukprot:TRINITY_DN3224_c0_g1_i1.p1 TRINITY_DN3224_c0_g1~~TRINITY_DN3224_c0_g1_i1.p1  ORF type:complete len:771 (+),score=117.82 TRINITY_DN3224_c0_g1_i1:81-2393(+)